MCVCVCLLLLSTILFSLWLLLSINDIPYMTVARKVMYSPTVQQYSHRPIFREIKLKINDKLSRKIDEHNPKSIDAHMRQTMSQ